MGAGGGGMGQVNGTFRSATPNSRYVGCAEGSGVGRDGGGGGYGKKMGKEVNCKEEKENPERWHEESRG